MSTGDGGRVVAFGSLGGTITMTSSGASGGIQPTLTAEGLTRSVPALAGLAEVRAETLSTLPGASLRPADVVRALDWAGAQVDAGAVGVVLAQGTDTLEETAYLADLYWDRPEPLVFTGAMRGPSQPSADGPANVLAACRVALCPDARERGVLVVLDDTVHAAQRVRKMHSTSLSAFRSPEGGPVGSVVEGEVRLSPVWRCGAHLAHPSSEPYVPLLETFLGDDGTILRTLTDRGVDGVVVAAFGVGHVSASLADELAAAATRVPVIVCTRTGSGGTLTRTYGFTGSEIDLQERGVILGGALDARKARLLLWALLAQEATHVRVRTEFAERGRR